MARTVLTVRAFLWTCPDGLDRPGIFYEHGPDGLDRSGIFDGHGPGDLDRPGVLDCCGLGSRSSRPQRAMSRKIHIYYPDNSYLTPGISLNFFSRLR
jgi:hypothetical protein